MERFIIETESSVSAVLHTLRQIAISGMSTQFFIFSLWLIESPLADGRQAVYEGVIGALNGLEPDIKYRLLHCAMDILGTSAGSGTSLKLICSVKIFPLLSNLLEKNIENYTKVVRQVLVEFTDCK